MPPVASALERLPAVRVHRCAPQRHFFPACRPGSADAEVVIYEVDGHFELSEGDYLFVS